MFGPQVAAGDAFISIDKHPILDSLARSATN